MIMKNLKNILKEFTNIKIGGDNDENNYKFSRRRQSSVRL